ncbi:hypothetical protein MBLNU459_g7381t2 [Dothideomycetes sp. NU459]
MTQIGSRDHSVGWYMTDDPNITKPSRELLEGYSGIPADRVISHVSGMDVRKLAFDGVPETQLYGAELEAEYIDLGYEFFLDRDRLQSRFIVADVFDLAGPLEELHGKIDIIQIGLFLHQFDWADQKKALEHVVRISKPSKGSMVVGRQVGSLIPASDDSGKRSNKQQGLYGKYTPRQMQDSELEIESGNGTIPAPEDLFSK